MKHATDFFHKISYLQYPLMALALYFIIKPLLAGFENGIEPMFADLNKALMFVGLGISFSTLQDTQKTQNKLSLKIYQNPRYARFFFTYVIVLILFFITIGMVGLFGVSNPLFKELSLGTIVLGIGMIGMLKAISEMIANHGQKE